MNDTFILAIESSCDETSVSIIKNGCDEIATVVLSQMDIHANYGGVVPEIASRHHIENITLEVSSKNNVAIDFYHKNKFCDVSVRKNYYPDGVDAIMMIRRF